MVHHSARAEHEQMGGVERAHQTMQGQLRSVRLDFRSRTGDDLVPGDILFPWAVRHAAWTIVRFQPRAETSMTPYQARRGVTYNSPLVPFGEIVMMRVPIDPTGLRKKLDTQWVKCAWVGRSERNDAHIGLTQCGIVIGSTVRRLPKELQFQPEFLKELRGEVGDPAMSQKQLQELLPLQIPLRVETANDEIVGPSTQPESRSDDVAMEADEQPVKDQGRVAADSREMDVEQQAEEGLGDAMATGSSSRRARQDDDEEYSIYRRTRSRTAIAALMDAAPASSLEDAGEQSHLYDHRSEASIRASREKEIDKFLQKGYVKDWKLAEAKATGARILTGVWVDPPHKEKSRYCAREFATDKDDTVFAAASDEQATGAVDFFAVKHGFPLQDFDAVSALQSPEEELIFIKPPPEYQARHDEEIVWQCVVKLEWQAQCSAWLARPFRILCS